MHPIKFALALSLSALALCAQAAPDALGQYASTLKSHTLKNIEYPRRALARNWEGEVLLKITIDSEGQVQDIQVVEESSHSSLNREALRSVERSNPYPPIPAALGISSYEFTMPVTFRLSQ